MLRSSYVCLALADDIGLVEIMNVDRRRVRQRNSHKNDFQVKLIGLSHADAQADRPFGCGRWLVRVSVRVWFGEAVVFDTEYVPAGEI
jgi:hypothetical protein